MNCVKSECTSLCLMEIFFFACVVCIHVCMPLSGCVCERACVCYTRVLSLYLHISPET